MLSAACLPSGRSRLAGNAAWAWGQEVAADTSQASLLPLPQTAEGGPRAQPTGPIDQGQGVGVLGPPGECWHKSQGSGFDSLPRGVGTPGSGVEEWAGGCTVVGFWAGWAQWAPGLP